MTNKNIAQLSVNELTAQISEIDSKIAELKAQKNELKKAPAFHEAEVLKKRQYHETINKNAKFGAKVAELLAAGKFDEIKNLKV